MDPAMRQGFIGIVVENRTNIEEVNRILSRYGKVIRGRIGVPGRDGDSA